jgi:hypothetical protein
MKDYLDSKSYTDKSDLRKMELQVKLAGLGGS